MTNEKSISSVSYYETSDLLLAATLQAHGLSIAATEWATSNRCNFFFEDSKELQEIIALFWQQKLRLEPNRLFSSLKTVKARLYSSN